jgi:hypothetical protein
MKFIEDCIPDDGAPEINVTGVSEIERITEGQVRVSYFRRRRGENVEAMHEVWDRQEWQEFCLLIQAAYKFILAEKPPNDSVSPLTH